MMFWQVCSAWAYAWNAGLTFCTGLLPGEWEDNKTVSDSYPVLVTPAGFAFAIWGPIFVLEGAYSVWQLGQPENSPLQEAAAWWCGACVLQGLWALAFAKRRLLLSSSLLSGIVLCLNMVHVIRVNQQGLPTPLLSLVPFSMHFSWTVAAALVNWNLYASQASFSRQARESIASASLLSAGAIGVIVSLLRRDPTISLVSVWALAAIKGKQKNAEDLKVSEESVSFINQLCTIGSAVAFATSLYLFFSQKSPSL